MNKKNTLIILFATALCLAFLIPSASAGGSRHQSGVVVVCGGYPQTQFFSNFVIAWPPYYGPSSYNRHHPRYRSHIYHSPPPPKHRDYRDRDKRGYRHR